MREDVREAVRLMAMEAGLDQGRVPKDQETSYDADSFFKLMEHHKFNVGVQLKGQKRRARVETTTDSPTSQDVSRFRAFTDYIHYHQKEIFWLTLYYLVTIAIFGERFYGECLVRCSICSDVPCSH